MSSRGPGSRDDRPTRAWIVPVVIAVAVAVLVAVVVIALVEGQRFF
ncbi:hypothetical protein [Frigoribacterium sp. VKM Ac-2836]|nr:hypothetical protein [Frigoribacterium sp. VKM Ac-2836]NRD27635.1 hypothetical protein [Frigoribacterium sp. VKM Ac-2836]